ncbi:hypothetical protein [Actinomyces qiguomingii]|uniref:hypothetical protein n=1 Tax=Actinomyces qiguomingii TaxID=2057800 RepID=UPI001E4624D5|nr:hypothetical protein [Actinomyces qiguomingii]
MAEASDSLRTVGTRLSSLHEDAELALSQVASRSSGVNAMRAALRSSITEHSELIARIGSLQTATAAACDGLIAVRRQVLACQDYVDANPYLSLADDGTVTAMLPTTSNMTATTAATTTGDSAGGTTPDAKLIQSQADELAGMVAAAVTLANQVDAEYAQALNTTSQAIADSGSHSFNRTKDSDTDKSRTGRVFPWGGRQSNSGDGTGHATNKTGLGNPVPGEHADMPGVDPWQYPGDSENEGSGKYAQRIATPHDHVVHELATLAAGACESMWPDASKNLYHYLQNTGEPQDINVDNMLTDLPDLPVDAQADAEWMASQAVADAQTSGTS